MEPNTEQGMLTELRKITAHFDRHKKVGKRIGIYFAIFIPAVMGVTAFAVYARRQELKTMESKLTWSKVSEAETDGNYDEALGIAQTLVKRTPNSHYSYRRLGLLYLEMNDLDKAHYNIKKAHSILPDYRNTDLLKAIEKRTKPDQANTD